MSILICALCKFRIIVLDRDGHAVMHKRRLFSVEKDRMTLKQAIINSIDSRCCREKQGKGNHQQFVKLVSGCCNIGISRHHTVRQWEQQRALSRNLGGGIRIRTGEYRLCRPLPYHLAMPPKKMERETRFELATSTLARSHSTTELFPLDQRSVN
jgi:hypothetical protein